MKRIITIKEFENQSDYYDKIKYLCKCGHKVIIPNCTNKQICSWCGNYVFRDKKEEFKYRLKESRNKTK